MTNGPDRRVVAIFRRSLRLCERTIGGSISARNARLSEDPPGSVKIGFVLVHGSAKLCINPGDLPH